MAQCIYCGNDAGWFKSVHEECKKAYYVKSARTTWFIKSAVDLTSRYVRNEIPRSDYIAQMQKILAQEVIAIAQMREILIEAWEQSLEVFLEDGVLSFEEEQR